MTAVQAIIQWSDKRISAYPSAAVAVWPEGTHVGVTYTDASGVQRAIHLAFHAKLRRELVRASHGWIPPSRSFLSVRLDHVAAMCERVWERHAIEGLPYGFRYDSSRFNADGTISIGAEERGLTCATFILAVYRSVGIELLRLSEWPQRPEDQAFFEGVIKALETANADQAHIDAVKKETQSLRYRPLEVAGGSSFAAPASFLDALAAATLIKTELEQHALGPTKVGGG
jgi:hypothetical protein